ncbi:xanthan lyase [Spartobacteria bacterium LR76]|nr:xanthan lyase [Spartobacteria bacterium LR76]
MASFLTAGENSITVVKLVPRYFLPAPFKVMSLSADICVYGGVSGGVIAALDAANRGLSVVLLEPSAHLGGMTAGGLGMTDVGNKHVIGGLSREFYRRVGRRYGTLEEWRFEPHVAEETFEQWLLEANVRVFKRQFIDEVSKEGNRIVAIRTVSGIAVRAAMFIDASYEGDLLALAGVSHFIGREGNSRYNETINGAQIESGHQFETPVDPYIIPGVPASGLLPGIDPDPSFAQGAGDNRVQTYNFRMCLTQRDDIRMPFPQPEGYDESWYILLKRFLATGWNEAFQKFDEIRNGKTDTNNHGAVSTDFIGQNYGWAAGSYVEREHIFQRHVCWQQGLMWCLANDSEVPAAIREPMSSWGLCADEFPESGGWPHALYVREARRMLGDYVMTEHNCRGHSVAEDSIGMAAYGMDSHHCRRMVRNGVVVNEGDVQVGGILPYPISYRAIVPREAECANLLAPFCISASHIAFGSIRMEPVFMTLGQSASVAASIALDLGVSVQQVPYPDLQAALLEAGQVLSRPPEATAFIVGITEAEALVHP